MPRTLAGTAIAGQLAFIASWVIADSLSPGYSAWSQGVSELATRHAPHAWIVSGGLVVLGLSFGALGLALRMVLPPRRAASLAAMLFVVTGLALALTAAFPMDCGLSTHACRARLDAGSLSWQSSAHVWLSLGASAALLLTPFAIARALWPTPAGAAALAAGAFGVLVGVAGEIAYAASAPQGISERLQLLAGHVWVLLVAGGILYTTGRQVRAAPLTPLRSREMFAASWAGEGEFAPWPALLGRLIRARFDLTRTATFLSEDMWTFDDRAVFAGGNALTQRLICTLQPSGRIHVTSDAVPGGSEVLLDDEGYRLTPYRYLVQIGPLRLTLRCREEHRVQADGSLLGTVRARWLGLPVGVMRWQAWRTDRPRSTEPAAAGDSFATVV